MPGGEVQRRSGLASVMLEQVVVLGGGRGDDAVGAGDDLFFRHGADEAGARFAGPTVPILDPSQGVERVGEGQPEALLEDHSRPSREPVVAVEHVERETVGVDPAQRLLGEVADQIRHPAQRHRLRRPGGDVDDPVAGPNVDHFRVVAGATGEHHHLDAAARDRLGHLVDVHVHAAGVADAGPLHRAGMEREEGDSPDHRATSANPVDAGEGAGAGPEAELVGLVALEEVEAPQPRRMASSISRFTSTMPGEAAAASGS